MWYNPSVRNCIRRKRWVTIRVNKVILAVLSLENVHKFIIIGATKTQKIA